MQVYRADLLKTGHVLDLDLAEAAEIDLRDRRDTRSAHCASGPGLALLERGLHELLHVFLEDTVLWPGWCDLGQVDPELAGQLANGRTCVHFPAFAARAAYRRGCRSVFGALRGFRRLRVLCRLARLRGGRLALRCRRFGLTGGFVAATGSGNLHVQQQIAGGDVLLQLRLDRFDGAGEGGGDLHAGLVRFQRHQRLVLLDCVAGLDQNLDDPGLAVTDVRNAHFAGRCLPVGRSALLPTFVSFSLALRGGLVLLGLFHRVGVTTAGAGVGLLRFAAGVFRFQFDQLRALLQRIAQVDLDGLDHAGLRARHFHAGLVRLQHHQALLGLDAVAFLDQYLDDLTFAADVRYLDQFAHTVLLSSPAGWSCRGRYRRRRWPR